MLTLDNMESNAKYVRASEVQFLPASGKYKYWDGEQEQLWDSVKGVVVWSGYQIRGTIGTPSKKKATEYKSQDFTKAEFNSGAPIHIMQFSRDGATKSSKSLGSKPYKEWKAEKKTLNRVVYLMQEDRTDRLIKLVFSPVASVPVGKALLKDQPNYITEFSVAPEMFETDSGEYYVPAVDRTAELPKKLESSVKGHMDECLRIILTSLSSNKTESAPSVAGTVTKKSEELSDEEIPF